MTWINQPTHPIQACPDDQPMPQTTCPGLHSSPASLQPSDSWRNSILLNTTSKALDGWLIWHRYIYIYIPKPMFLAWLLLSLPSMIPTAHTPRYTPFNQRMTILDAWETENHIFVSHCQQYALHFGILGYLEIWSKRQCAVRKITLIA